MQRWLLGVCVSLLFVNAAWAAEPGAVKGAVPAPTGTTLTVAAPAQTAAPQITREHGLTDLASMEEMLLSDQVMVQTASRHAEKLSETPGSVIVITEQEIRERGALNLQELLTNYAGVEFEFESTVQAIRIRGVEAGLNNKVLVLVDGRKVNTPDWGNFEPNFGVNLDNVKQIEFVKGPGSALYGANAFSGVINIITKSGKEINGVTLTGSIAQKPNDGELSQYYLATYGREVKGTEYRVEASYWRELGVDPINLNQTDNDFTGGQPNNLFTGAKADIAIKRGDEWTLNAGFHQMQDPYPGYYDVPTPQGQNTQSLLYADGHYYLPVGENSRLSLHVEDSFYPDRSITRPVITMKRVNINSPADIPAGVNLIYDEQGGTQPALNAVGGQYFSVSYLPALINGTAANNIVIGGSMNELLTEAQFDMSWPERNYFIGGVSFYDDSSNENYLKGGGAQDENYAAYAQDEYRFLENVILLAGLRYDQNSSYGGDLSPRGSLIYSPLEGLRVKALYGTAFRAPSFIERYSQSQYQTADLIGNPDLKPEQISQSEARVEYELGKWFSASGGYFYWQTNNEIQFKLTQDKMYVYSPDMSLIDPSFPASPGFLYLSELEGYPTSITWANLTSRLAHGVELETKIQPLPFMQVNVNYSRFHQYPLVSVPAELADWAEGDVDLLNAVLGFNYFNYYLRIYGHLSHSPRYYSPVENENFLRVPWLTQYDVSLGGTWGRWQAGVTAFNVLKSNNYYNLAKDDYYRGPATYRLDVGYHIPF